MDGMLYLRGLAVGFAIAAPIGPVGILCIRKAMADGRIAAWGAGLGAALADGLFGAVVGLGVGAVSAFLRDHTVPLKLFGGVFMMLLALRAWRTVAAEMGPAEERGLGLWRDVLSTFTITMTNPGTVLGVMGVFAALGPTGRPVTPDGAVMLVAGVFCGSALWWAILTELTVALRSRFSQAAMQRFNRISGALLFLFGLGALISVLFE